MRRSRTARLVATWLATLAVLLAALAPTLSHALGSTPAAAAIEVCSAEGSRWLPSGDDGGSPTHSAAHALEHCPYCSLQSDLPLLPPPAVTALLPASPRDTRPAAFVPAPRTPHARVAAQPRAPPFSA